MEDVIEEPIVLSAVERRAIQIVIMLVISAIFFIIGLSGEPRLSSVSMDILIIFYAIMISVTPELSYIPAAAMLALHIASIISYYGNPLVLPFVVIERHGAYRSMNIDFVQIIVAYELLRRLIAWRRESFKNPGSPSESAGSIEGEPR